MGGSEPSTPTPPPQPTMGESMQDYIQNYPALWEMQMRYAPQEAELGVELAQQYAQPYGEALKTAQEAMYPTETAITQTAGQQALEGMQGEMPDWMRKQYEDQYRANLGTSAGSPMGADYTSRGMLGAQQDYQNYYRNLGLSISGKQPIQQAQPVGYTNQMAQYTPQGAMNFAQQGYGNYAGLYGNMYDANARLAASENAMWGSAIGGGLSGFGSFLGAIAKK
jgi:hypothetical protein